MKKLPIFKALISNKEDKMVTISLVDYPATESDFVAFEKENELVRFSVENEDKRLVRGLVMAANQLIYRISPNFGEYYIMYEPETIRMMAEKYLKDGFQNNVDLMHDGNLVDGVNMVQFFIKDSANGINPKPFEDYDDGSLFAEFHIENDAVWEQVKNGDFKGFSLEGFFSVEPIENAEMRQEMRQDVAIEKNENNNEEQYKKTMSKLQKIKEALRTLLLEFGEVSTDKGVVIFDGDELEAGMEVHGIDEQGQEVQLEDGEYRTTDNKVIVIAEGKVVEIKDDEAEVSTEPEVVEEESNPQENAEEETEPETEPENTEPDEKDELIRQLQEQIAQLQEENSQLQERIKELEEKPAAMSAQEEFEKLEAKEPKTEADKKRKKGYIL